jgi:predicted AlkP superfamily phosphohydrolase/phosphomutase
LAGRVVVFGQRRGKRVVVLGLDGTPYTLIKKLAQEGVMPHMSDLIGEGNFYQMDTTIPEISSVAWSSFMTGQNAGEHGIFGFTDIVPGTYKIRFPNFSDLKYPPIWKEIEKQKKKTVVINLPGTYPARPINGVLISGFVALRLEKASYPEKIIPFLKSMGYRIDVDTMKAREDKDFLIKDLKETLHLRKRAIHHFWDKEKWNLFIAVITGTDRLQHFLMDAFFDENHKYHQQFLDYYNLIDRQIIREIKQRCNNSSNLIILSDHGFTKIEQEVYLNRWLLEEGYIRFKKDNPESIEDMGEESKAFALDPGRIYINVKGKYPAGGVSGQEEYDELCDELKRKLYSLEYNGKKVVKDVFKRDEVYSGSYSQNSPDLIAVSNYGFDLKGTVKSPKIFGKTVLTGMHTQDDAFVLLPSDESFPEKPHISQLKEVILRLM